MKNHSFKISFILVIGLISSCVTSQTMYIKTGPGTQTAYPVANIQKLTFSSGNLLVTNTTGDIDTFAIADNRYINFTNLILGTVLHQVVINSFYVYPNPANIALTITNKDHSQNLSHLEIISLEGRVLIEQKTPEVNITSLPIGMYFCKITSNNKTQTIKFLKQ